MFLGEPLYTNLRRMEKRILFFIHHSWKKIEEFGNSLKNRACRRLTTGVVWKDLLVINKESLGIIYLLKVIILGQRRRQPEFILGTQKENFPVVKPGRVRHINDFYLLSTVNFFYYVDDFDWLFFTVGRRIIRIFIDFFTELKWMSNE